jgi:hypothetical protein
VLRTGSYRSTTTAAPPVYDVNDTSFWRLVLGGEPFRLSQGVPTQKPMAW